MDQPMGFSVEGKEYIVCKLKKSIYSLKQTSCQWYLRFNDTIAFLRFKENIVDQCIYLNVSGSKVIFLILYVDDILLVINDLSSNFEVKDMCEVSYVMGIEIFCNRPQALLGLSQKAYINKVQETSKMERCSTLHIPI